MTAEVKPSDWKRCRAPGWPGGQSGVMAECWPGTGGRRAGWPGRAPARPAAVGWHPGGGRGRRFLVNGFRVGGGRQPAAVRAEELRRRYGGIGVAPGGRIGFGFGSEGSVRWCGGEVGSFRSALPAVDWWVPGGRVSPTAGGVRRCFAPLSLAFGRQGVFQVPYRMDAPRVLASPVAPRDCSVESGGISPAGPVAILMLTGGGRDSRWEPVGWCGRWVDGRAERMGSVVAGGVTGVVRVVATGVVDGSRYGWWIGTRTYG